MPPSGYFGLFTNQDAIHGCYLGSNDTATAWDLYHLGRGAVQVFPGERVVLRWYSRGPLGAQQFVCELVIPATVFENPASGATNFTDAIYPTLHINPPGAAFEYIDIIDG